MAIGMSRLNESDNRDDDDSLDENQLSEYQEMVEELGSFPDKVKINSLTMIAEDYADSESSAGSIYRIIRDRLLNTGRDNMLPLVYVIDSILKNVKGNYVNILEKDAVEWMPLVYKELQEAQRAKLQKVWKTWNEFKLFSTENWRNIGRCFDDRSVVSNISLPTTLSEVAGIKRTKDGTLVLSDALRKEMQKVLDEIQSEVNNELEKVSLERLADINPDLLAKIKNLAEDELKNGATQQEPTKVITTEADRSLSLPSFFIENRTPATIELSKEWTKLKNWNYLEQTHDVIKKLQHSVVKGGSSESGNLYTREEALKMTNYYATVSVTAALLTSALEQMQKQEDSRVRNANLIASGANKKSQTAVSGGSFAVDKKEFTNDGIKVKNEAVIGLLYEIGLPFVSSADGRRFRTQLELSNHLDALFKRNQLEKSMARTEERGWYIIEGIWTGEIKQEDLQATSPDQNEMDQNAGEGDNDPNGSTVPADESRDRCVICGINFKMFFDNDDGIYKYSNCREIEVLNDDAAEHESENMLVHVTCWKGLGAPEILTMDQALQDALPH